MRGWLRWATLAISLIPVLALAAIVVVTFIGSLPALQQVGLNHMFGPDLTAPMTRAPRVQYGLLAPIFGTFLVAVLAMLVALPTAVCLAVVAREFQVPVLSRAIGTIVGTLGGIPPVIYVVMAIFFVQAYMQPKFSGWVFAEEQRAILQGLPHYSPNALPLALPNSMLLGGLLMALLIIPFIAPLVDDAFRGVPAELKQGSYALGATRWQTLWRIVLPRALPGIITAVGLGTLVGIGEMLIPAYVLGGAENPVAFPTPPWNVLKHTPTLSAVGTSLQGSSEQELVAAIQRSMAYVSSLFLLVFAALVMLAESLVRRTLQSHQ